MFAPTEKIIKALFHDHAEGVSTETGFPLGSRTARDEAHPPL